MFGIDENLVGSHFFQVGFRLTSFSTQTLLHFQTDLWKFIGCNNCNADLLGHAFEAREIGQQTRILLPDGLRLPSPLSKGMKVEAENQQNSPSPSKDEMGFVRELTIARFNLCFCSNVKKMLPLRRQMMSVPSRESCCLTASRLRSAFKRTCVTIVLCFELPLQYVIPKGIRSDKLD